MSKSDPFQHDNALVSESQRRKETPMASGLLDYFPEALAAVAELSYLANDKHNPGEPMHWAKEKSNDHADCIVRHLTDRGKWITGEYKRSVRHSTAVAWRALALLQTEIEAERAVKVDVTPISKDLKWCGSCARWVTGANYCWSSGAPAREDCPNVAARDITDCRPLRSSCPAHGTDVMGCDCFTDTLPSECDPLGNPCREGLFCGWPYCVDDGKCESLAGPCQDIRTAPHGYNEEY